MNILVGVTTSPEGRAAVRRAIDEAEVRGAHLHLVRISGDPLPESPASAMAAARDKQLFESLLPEEARLAEVRGVHTRFTVRTRAQRTVGQELLDYAYRIDADLIVIGMRRRSRVGKLVLGSNAQEVLLGADCPVLAVWPSVALDGDQ